MTGTLQGHPSCSGGGSCHQVSYPSLLDDGNEGDDGHHGNDGEASLDPIAAAIADSGIQRISSTVCIVIRMDNDTDDDIPLQPCQHGFLNNGHHHLQKTPFLSFLYYCNRKYAMQYLQ